MGQIMRLSDPWFSAKFYGNINNDKSFQHLDSIEGAQGLWLWCPCGYGKLEFPLDGARPHCILVPFNNPRNAPKCPDEHGPISKNNPTGPRPRWNMIGNDLNDLTITPSIDVGNITCWHGFITNGEIK